MTMAKTARIVPAILTDSVCDLAYMVRLANSFADFVQIDIMDGIFVPPKSITAADVAALDVRFCWEAHLMVSRPSEDVESFVRAGAKRVIVHAEAGDDVSDAIRLARSMCAEVGLALNPETSIDGAERLLQMVDSVLLLTVEPGYYGSRFLPHVLSKVPVLRASYPALPIAVDGGIKEQNVCEVASTGVDEICVGSAIFRADSPAAAYYRLRDSVARKC